MAQVDVVVVGSGPNGLSAALAAARAGCKVLVLEAQSTPGGAARTLELTIPGFQHDFGSAIHPFAAASPFFRSLPLEKFGLRWIQPAIPLAHPLADGSAVVLLRSITETAGGLGDDAGAYAAHMRRIVDGFKSLVGEVAYGRLPRHAVALVRFGLAALMSAEAIARSWFRSQRARALIAGLGAHSALPLGERGTGAAALALAAAAHEAGWPFPQGGAGQITRALIACLQSLGGEVHTGCAVHSLHDLPPASIVFWDVTPKQLLRIAGDALPPTYGRALARYRYGPGACKIDWALAEPIPWTAPECRQSGTVHLGGTWEEIAAAESAVWQAKLPALPYVLLAQPTVFDPTRAPAGQHVAWAYCHVPNGSEISMAAAIENQIERFAPGFRKTILARSVLTAVDLEVHDENLVGGDVSGGLHTIGQMLFRPTARLYSIPLAGHYLCSSSTPPGAGVHGMSGYLAARFALGGKVNLQGT